MATEFFTRLQLKYDSYENWSDTTVAGQKGNLVLLAGEIGICTIPTDPTYNGTREAPEGVHNPPHVLFKVGDGSTPFYALHWASAKAADVYAWAKAETVRLKDQTLEFVNLAKGDKPEEIIHSVDLSTFVTEEELTSSLANYKTKQTAVTATGSTVKTVTKVEQNANGEVTITYEDINFPKIPEVTLPTVTDVAVDGQYVSKVDQTNGAISVTRKAATTKLVPEKANNNNMPTDKAVVDYVNEAIGEAVRDLNFPDISIVDDTTVETPTAETVNVYKNLTAAGHQLTEELVQVATKKAVDNALAAAKTYADNNDANTEYHIVYDSTNKLIKLVEGKDAKSMEIDATDFIKDGMIESVALSKDGLKLVITWNTDAEKGEDKVTEIPLSGLVDVYTGKDGTTIKVEVSNDEISAEVKEGVLKNAHIASDAAIAKTKLATDVQTSLGLADGAVQTITDSALGQIFKKSGTTVTAKVDRDLATSGTSDVSIPTSGAVVKHVTARLDALGSSESGVGPIVTNVTQTDGKVAVTKGNITLDQVAANTKENYVIFNCGSSTEVI